MVFGVVHLSEYKYLGDSVMRKLHEQYFYEMTMLSDKDKVKTIMPVAAAVIVKEGDNGERLILLIQRAKSDAFPNHYEFARGKCDKGKNEDLIKCCKREAKEETGLDIIPIKEIDIFEYLADGGTRKSICHNFLCIMKDSNQKVKLSFEHQDHRWIQSVGEAENLVLPDQKKTIAKVFNLDKQIINYPENNFSKNNQIEEYLNLIQ